MPLVGVNQAADDIINIINMDGSNGTDLMANESFSDNGTMSKRIKAINEIPENEITLDQLLMNLATSGNEKHVQLASDLLELNLVQDNLGLNGSGRNEQEIMLDSNVKSDNLDCLDKISFSANGNQNSEHETTSDNNTETNIGPKIRVRSNSNDSEKVKLDITVSPSKKQKSHNKDVKTTLNGIAKQNTRTKSETRTRKALSKVSVLIAITEIPENTYLNSIKMENMI